MKKKSILIASPIHQKHEILEQFLLSLQQLNLTSFQVDFLFVDDNDEYLSRKLLNEFKVGNSSVEIVTANELTEQELSFHKNETTHQWDENSISRVAQFKNYMIKSAINENYDFLFLIDSDLLLHPQTLVQLVNSKKDIISNIFWTQWQPGSQELPQVWEFDHYSQYKFQRGIKLSKQEIVSRTKEFLNKLKTPGVYEVGGLGACTLISRTALCAGVNFNEVRNISFWGEDRHFCIRAVVLGFSLCVDTHYPAFHIYRMSDLERVQYYKESNKRRDAVLLEHEILEKTKIAIESLGSYHYTHGYKNSWEEYFTREMVVLLHEEHLTNKDNYIADRVEVTAQVTGCAVHKADAGNQTIVTSFILTNSGNSQAADFFDKYFCYATFLAQENDWKIAAFDIVEKLN
ncbi:hypothetical protein [Paenibacillus sp. OAS669]|uniref:hypothetical protein n=1 Tax=Paenibacillus sp. OAS669 TaxID=2663821 RepID=UPI0019ED46A8|nr:hypothetical protein [Paenibacillus sp. OAS669]MBE1447421.1 hypothetical protein [Paenibacillus sp. OAS669]